MKKSNIITTSVLLTSLTLSTLQAQEENTSTTNTQEQDSENIAAQEAPPLESTVEQVAPNQLVVDENAVVIEELQIAITPPEGWVVSTKSLGLSAILQEKKDDRPSYNKPKYRRNITIAAIHKSSPIDDKRAEQLKEELVKNYSKDWVVQNFQILGKHSFFDYKGKKDGLLIYSSLEINQYQMSQMHILVSNESKQFLLSYTDLESRFNNDEDPGYNAAWQSMVSLAITGAAPSRAIIYAKYSSPVIILLLIFIIVMIKKYRNKRVKYDSENENSDFATSTQAKSLHKTDSSTTSDSFFGTETGSDTSKIDTTSNDQDEDSNFDTVI